MNVLLAVSVGSACAAASGTLWLLSEPAVSLYARSVLSRWSMRRKVAEGRRRPLYRTFTLPNRVRGMLRPFVSVFKTRNRERAKALERDRCLSELAELIDVVALGLSAGVPFDASLEIYCARYATSLSGHLSQAMLSWRLGLASRKGALRALAARLEVGAFTTFVDTVTESLDFGAPLALALTDQSKAIREEHRAMVQERIEKAPVKMLIPTGGLSLPAMLLAILGPLLASLTELVV